MPFIQRRAPSASRRGVTLLELCVAIVVLSLVGGAVTAAWLGIRSAMYALGGTEHARSTLRQAGAALRAELRGVAAVDLIAAADTALELWQPVAASVVCRVDGTVLVLPPRAAASPLATWRTDARPGDRALVHRAASDDWASVAVLDASVRAGAGRCPADGALVAVTDAARPQPALALAGLPAGVEVGAPVHVVRRARWSLYRGGDGHWQLGRRDCTGPAPAPCATVQPVAGPLLRAAPAPAAAGLTVAVHDAAGAPVAVGDPRAALLRIVLRAERGAAVESLGVSVALRGGG